MTLVLLVVIAFALITLDIRDGSSSPLDGVRSTAANVFGPLERGVSGVVDPVGNWVQAQRDAGSQRSTINKLKKDNVALKEKLAANRLSKDRSAQLTKMLGAAAAGRYKVLAAQVIAIGAAQSFSWTITIDAGSRDGIRKDMTVLDGEGLVGRVTTVGSSTATVLLANDPSSTVGARLEKSHEVGFATGGGEHSMKATLLNGHAKVKPGDRLVTSGSKDDRPFVPGVPIGTVTRVDRSPGGLTRVLTVKPFVDYTSLDLVGVVVEPPTRSPRDAVLPPKPKPTKKPAKKSSQKKSSPKKSSAAKSGASAKHQKTA